MPLQFLPSFFDFIIPYPGNQSLVCALSFCLLQCIVVLLSYSSSYNVLTDYYCLYAIKQTQKQPKLFVIVRELKPCCVINVMQEKTVLPTKNGSHCHWLILIVGLKFTFLLRATSADANPCFSLVPNLNACKETQKYCQKRRRHQTYAICKQTERKFVIYSLFLIFDFWGRVDFMIATYTFYLNFGDCPFFVIGNNMLS